MSRKPVFRCRCPTSKMRPLRKKHNRANVPAVSRSVNAGGGASPPVCTGNPAWRSGVQTLFPVHRARAARISPCHACGDHLTGRNATRKGARMTPLTNCPKPPADLEPYVEVLGPELAVMFFLRFGGSEVYCSNRPGRNGRLQALIGPANVRALAAVSHRLQRRVPLGNARVAPRSSTRRVVPSRRSPADCGCPM